MSFQDKISGVFARLTPAKSSKPSASMSGGISNSHGISAFRNDVSNSFPIHRQRSCALARPDGFVWDTQRLASHYVIPCIVLHMGDSSSQLAFLLFIPVLTTLWIWVCSTCLIRFSSPVLILLQPDDCFETGYRFSMFRKYSSISSPWHASLALLPFKLNGTLVHVGTKHLSETHHYAEQSPAGLTGFTLFVTILGMFLSAFMMFVPVIYENTINLLG